MTTDTTERALEQRVCAMLTHRGNARLQWTIYRVSEQPALCPTAHCHAEREWRSECLAQVL